MISLFRDAAKWLEKYAPKAVPPPLRKRVRTFLGRFFPALKPDADRRMIAVVRKAEEKRLSDNPEAPEKVTDAEAAAFALGRGSGGGIVTGDLEKFPHVLIADTTGSVKSVRLNSLIVSLLYKSAFLWPRQYVSRPFYGLGLTQGPDGVHIKFHAFPDFLRFSHSRRQRPAP